MKELFRLSWRLATVEFKLRNEGSYLGSLWYLLNPIFLFLILFFIFFDRLGGAIPSYPAYLSIGIIMFSFFSRTTADATRAIIENVVIKSINFPRESLILAVVLKNIFSHLPEVIVFFTVLSFFFGIPFYTILWYLCVLVFVAVFAYGVSLFLAAVAVYVVDVGNVWQFFTTLLWFITPIFYAIEGQIRLFILNIFNPPFYFITTARDLVIHGEFPDTWVLLGVLVYPLVSLLVGLLVFTKLKHRFPELI